MKNLSFGLCFLLAISSLTACISSKKLNPSEEHLSEESISKIDTTSIELQSLLAKKDSLIKKQTDFEEEKALVLESIRRTRVEIDEHDELNRKKSPEYQEMLPIYTAVSNTRETPEYKRLSKELGAAQVKMNEHAGNAEFKKLYDAKLKEYKTWEITSGRADLKKQLLPLREKFIAYEAKSGRTALGNKIQTIERRRIAINKELTIIKQQLIDLETKIQANK